MSFKPPSPTAETAAVMPQLVDLAPVPGQDGALLVCTRSPELHVMSTEGEVLRWPRQLALRAGTLKGGATGGLLEGFWA